MEAAHPKCFFATLDGCSSVSYKSNQKFILAYFPSQSWALKWESQFGETPGESNCGFVRLLACSLDKMEAGRMTMMKNEDNRGGRTRCGYIQIQISVLRIERNESHHHHYWREVAVMSGSVVWSWICGKLRFDPANPLCLMITMMTMMTLILFSWWSRWLRKMKEARREEDWSWMSGGGRGMVIIPIIWLSGDWISFWNGSER